MRRLPHLVIALCLSIVCFACATVEPLSQNDEMKARLHYPTVTLEQLNAGRALYANKCGRCHFLYPLSKLTREDWHREIATMKHKAGLGESDVTLIEQYLSTGAKESQPRDSISKQ